MSTMFPDIGIGVDIEEISRFEDNSDRLFTPFLKKNFTDRELEYCLSKDHPASHIAARFAGKEAVIKALSSMNVTGIRFPLIEILNDDLGVPCVRINMENTQNIIVKLSLSHSPRFAVAFCVVIASGM